MTIVLIMIFVVGIANLCVSMFVVFLAGDVSDLVFSLKNSIMRIEDNVFRLTDHYFTHNRKPLTAPRVGARAEIMPPITLALILKIAGILLPTIASLLPAGSPGLALITMLENLIAAIPSVAVQVKAPQQGFAVAAIPPPLEALVKLVNATPDGRVTHQQLIELAKQHQV